MRHRTFLFDLDGTLIDHFAAIHRCHSYALRQLGRPEPTRAEIRAVVGGGLEVAIAQLVGPENVATALAHYRPHWEATMLDDVVLFPGARELLQMIKSRDGRSAIFTNKHGPSSRRLSAHLGLDPWLVGNFGATDTAWLKPAPEFARHALTALEADAATTALIGDSPYDLAAAQLAGFSFYAVTTGTHTAEQLRTAGAVNIYPDLTTLATDLLA